MSFLSRLTHPPRVEAPELETPEQIDAFIDSRALAYASKIEDDFVERALKLGVDGGMILDVGTRTGLIVLKILWQNAGFYAIGMDQSRALIERARDTAAAWGLDERAFFQVGDARKMRLKTAYFDLVISDSTLHVFDDPLSVLKEINRVLKPKGGLLIRDLQRPSRFRMKERIEEHSGRYGARMQSHVATALRAAFTRGEIQALMEASGLDRVRLVQTSDHFIIERTGESDPNSWITAREQYR
jgi:ubiquinone/menaquinone biosynthesis C-methylase UbiE